MIYINPDRLKYSKIATTQSEYQKNLDLNALQIANVVADDGDNEDANKAALRLKRNAIKSKFESDMKSILTGE